MNSIARIVRKISQLALQLKTRSAIGRWQRAGATFGSGTFLQGRQRIEVKTGGRLLVRERVFLGDGVVIEIGAGGSVELGAGVCLRENCVIRCEGNLTIGEGTFLNNGVICECQGTLHIGAKVLIAPQVHLYDFDHGTDSCDVPIIEQPLKIGHTSIGAGAWLGAKATVTRDVHIGEGTIIGAGAVVVRDVPAFAVAVGVPARVRRFRKESGQGQSEP